MESSIDNRQQWVWAMSGPALWRRSALVFILSLVALTALYAPSPLLYDADSYYHLAIARAYAEDGLFDRLEWVRFGLLGEQFGDKELLFHAVLVPFAAWMEPMVGGRMALALLGATVLATIGMLSMRAIGGWGMLVPFWLLLGSLEFSWRLVRLRPELASLLVLLLALWAAVQRRPVVLGILSLVYALTYTAIHAYLGIFLLVFLAQIWVLRRWDWWLLVYPLLGAGIGLILHPQFPSNLAVWWYQSVEYFRLKGVLDVGSEIEPMRTDLAVLVNFGWLVGLAVLWRGSEKVASRQASAAALTFGVAAAAFGLLYVMMSRFALYFMVLATLWMLFEMHRCGRQPSPWLRLPGRGRLPQWMAWALVLLVCLPVASYELGRFRQRNDPGPQNARIADREAFAEALPTGAKVANPWRSTPIYMFWAPQGRYLDVLDPVFVAAYDPAVHRAREGIFSGREPDVPLLARGLLDSEFVAYSAATGNPVLTQRLLADPRIESVYQGNNLLFRIRAPQGDPFVVDWRLVPVDQSLPVTAPDLGIWERYPLQPEAPLRELEGFIEAGRVVAPGECLGLVHELVAAQAELRWFELAPLGPTAIWLESEPLADLQGAPGAVLGQGTLLPVQLTAGAHRISILTCPEPATGRAGFYLLERQRV